MVFCQNLWKVPGLGVEFRVGPAEGYLPPWSLMDLHDIALAVQNLISLDIARKWTRS